MSPQTYSFIYGSSCETAAIKNGLLLNQLSALIISSLYLNFLRRSSCIVKCCGGSTWCRWWRQRLYTASHSHTYTHTSLSILWLSRHNYKTYTLTVLQTFYAHEFLTLVLFSSVLDEIHNLTSKHRQTDVTKNNTCLQHACRWKWNKIAHQECSYRRPESQSTADVSQRI